MAGVGSLSRPGGNITGVALLVSELVPKRLEVLHEMVPSAAVIGFLAIRTIRIHRLTSKTFRHRPIYFYETCGSSMPQQSIRRLRWFYMLEESLKAFLADRGGAKFFIRSIAARRCVVLSMFINPLIKAFASSSSIDRDSARGDHWLQVIIRNGGCWLV